MIQGEKPGDTEHGHSGPLNVMLVVDLLLAQVQTYHYHHLYYLSLSLLFSRALTGTASQNKSIAEKKFYRQR